MKCINLITIIIFSISIITCSEDQVDPKSNKDDSIIVYDSKVSDKWDIYIFLF